MGEAVEAKLAERYELVGPLKPPLEGSLAALPKEALDRIRAVLSIGMVPITERHIARLPSLGLIACLGSGYEGVDVGAARKRGIMVTHGRDANAASVADLAIGLMIESVRQLPAARARLYAGQWQGNVSSRSIPMKGLTGRKLGIYGLGAIGQRIALRAQALEMDVGYHNRRPRADVSYPYFGTLHELASWCDVLTISVRADATNRHAINAKILEAIGADGHLINVARGSVVDQQALCAALRDGTIAGAGLDVFEDEPHVPAELLELPNVALTPHIGGNTAQARKAMETLLVANVDAFFAGVAAVTPVR